MLTQLAAFEAVVRLGSVTRAADALCIAQPTLSGHLRKLADALGTRLFEQHGKRLVPTPSAQVLLQATREVFATLEACDRMLDEQRDAAAAPRPFDQSTRDLPTARRMPRSSASGGGGQPGTSTSTGITFETRPQLA